MALCLLWCPVTALTSYLLSSLLVHFTDSAPSCSQHGADTVPHRALLLPFSIPRMLLFDSHLAYFLLPSSLCLDATFSLRFTWPIRVGTYVHPWQIHVDVWQNQYSIVKLKKIKNLKIRNRKKKLKHTFTYAVYPLYLLSFISPGHLLPSNILFISLIVCPSLLDT